MSDLDRAPSPSGGVTVLIPALNEERGLSATLAAVQAAGSATGLPLEVIVVDDGSTDGTRQVAEQAGAVVYSHPCSGGYGRSLKTGLRAASHELIVITDADGTYPIEELPKLIQLAGRYDMVVGARTGLRYRRTVLLSPFRTLFLLLTNFVIGSWIPDPNSGFRVFRKSHVLPLLERLPNGFSFTTTLTLVLTLNGSFIHYHPVRYGARIGRSKVRFLRDALRAGQGMIEIILHYNPLKLFLVVSFVPLLAALVVLGCWRWIAAAPVIATILFGVSLVVFALGMVAVSAKRSGRS